MANAQTDEPTREQPLRLWPGVVAVVLQWLIRFVVPVVESEAIPVGVMGGLFTGLVVMVWWGFFSRAPRSERWVAVALMIAALVVTSRFLHESIATSMNGLTFVVYAVPVLSLAFVVWAVVSRSLPEGPRRVSMVATILLACGVWTLVRTGGFTGADPRPRFRLALVGDAGGAPAGPDRVRVAGVHPGSSSHGY